MMTETSGQFFAESNVSSELRKDKGIQKLTENMCFYVTTLYCMNDYENGKKITMKMDTSNKLNIAGSLAGFKYYKVNYNDSWEIKTDNSIQIWAQINMRFVSNLYEKMFGSKLKKSQIEDDEIDLRYRNDKYYTLIGDFGEAGPSYTIKQISKKDGKSFKIKALNRLKGEDTDSIVGTTWITVKKDKNTDYGYKITKCSYKIRTPK